MTPVYISARTAPSGGWFGYVHERDGHAILARTGLSIDRDGALERAWRLVNASGFKGWHLVAEPLDAPPMFDYQARPC